MSSMKTLLDLGTQPLVNNLCASADAALSAECFALKAICEEDLTIRLCEEVHPSRLYANYLYRSGVSLPYIEHCEQLFRSLVHLNLETVIDIGGNDGTLLNTFRKASQKYKSWSGIAPKRFINVDMSQNLEAINVECGNEYVCGQFSDEMDLPKANLIVSTNVFQHTKDVHAFLRGITKFLDGVWVLEFPYTLTTLQTLQFDQFYHEHYYYWLVSPLAKLFKEYGLSVIAIRPQDIHGGSLRMWMTNKAASSPEATSTVQSYIEAENNIDFDSFNANCTAHMDKSRDFLSSLKGKTAFFGAAAKGCVFLNALNLTINDMPDSFVVDDTIDKQGLFVPGTGFEVRDRGELSNQSIDNVIILAHNFSSYIAKSLRNNYGGRIYTCLPKIEEIA